jgi:8-oxo-dGTP pyrophosphatase MutT (NUDIX family)
VRAGESCEHAAIRECLEETGLAVRVVERCAVVRHDYAQDRVELHFFRCMLVDSERQPREPFRWAPAVELAELQFPEANRAVLEQLVAAYASAGVSSH